MKSRSTGHFALIALAAIGTLVLILSRSVAVELVYPVEHAKRTFLDKVWSRVSGAFNASAVSAENIRLSQSVKSLELLRVDIEQLERENARLRRVLDYSARHPEMWIAAEVLSKGGGAVGNEHTIRVGKGSLDGVEVGAVVVVPEGLVGKVKMVTPHTSEITLITDSSLQVACEVNGVGCGILSGSSGDTLRLCHLREAARFRPQSEVFTSGRGGVFPRGIRVGALLSVTNGVRSIDGGVRPAVDYWSLEDVFIRREK